MKYNIECKEFFRCSLYDLMQGVGQGKSEFMYKPQNPPALSDLSDYLWDYPKPFTDAEMIEFWRIGNVQKVLEFASGQMLRILALYILFRRITENPYTAIASGSTNSAPTVPPPITVENESMLTIPEANLPQTWLAKCPNDLSEWDVPITQSEFICPIDGTIIRRQ